jgi:hypothetical protein
MDPFMLQAIACLGLASVVLWLVAGPEAIIYVIFLPFVYAVGSLLLH